MEKEGRKHQLLVAMGGIIVAAKAALFTFKHSFPEGLIPPINHVNAVTIQSGVSSGIAIQLMIWTIPGALKQFIGGDW